MLDRSIKPSTIASATIVTANSTKLSDVRCRDNTRDADCAPACMSACGSGCSLICPLMVALIAVSSWSL
ncbi:hypothetical protein BTHE_1880 [Bifidobacterium thermophilum]|nr:hypothetical protein BTHE_1880 [Bifidobacterium thermophilum]